MNIKQKKRTQKVLKRQKNTIGVIGASRYKWSYPRDKTSMDNYDLVNTQHYWNKCKYALRRKQYEKIYN